MSYITRRPKQPRATAFDDVYIPLFSGGPEHMTVHEPESEAEYTGLLDAQGNEICRVPDRLAMGFRQR